jgi:hypothetical protein
MNYETFDMNMSVYPAQWAKALASVERSDRDDSELEPSIETMQEAVVRVLRQIADSLESGDGWNPRDHPIHINGERVGHASFGNV